MSTPPAVAWTRSRSCEGGACIEVAPAPLDGFLFLRAPGSTDPLCVTREEWDAFLAGARAGDFDTV